MNEKHLGGHAYMTHVDEGAVKTVMNELEIKSFLDIGCGTGGMIPIARNLGLDAVGVDGDDSFTREVDIVIHDYTKGPSSLSRAFDLVWSVEFVEHVEEQYIDNFMKDFKLGKYVLITYSPHPFGHHHVNPQEESYWIDLFTKHGFEFDQEMTLKIRAGSTMERDFMRDRGLFFNRK